MHHSANKKHLLTYHLMILESDYFENLYLDSRTTQYFKILYITEISLDLKEQRKFSSNFY